MCLLQMSNTIGTGTLRGDCFSQMVGTNTILQWADERLGSDRVF